MAKKSRFGKLRFFFYAEYVFMLFFIWFYLLDVFVIVMQISRICYNPRRRTPPALRFCDGPGRQPGQLFLLSF